MIQTFNEYQKEAVKLGISLDKFKKLHPDMSEDVLQMLAVAYDGLGLGEAGEVQGKIKKIIRDEGGIITDEAREAIKAELSDVLWYMASMCHNLGTPLNEVAEYGLNKIKGRHARGTLHGSGDNR
jgi:NTP pyrophosphatase (non-canonical NTP hydrolase)